ncbi:hypothetical protein VO56_00695 [Mycoplasmopsis gallinacea]|uniref:Lipoprotein n=1 Tax=Mycoplasmopsis gallinacea TaxID=29556 RepID=A0A0D5ZJF6_9BACT|nr:hypothetical protein VO56_00695 [Mycoplasmopsis gallinacea]
MKKLFLNLCALVSVSLPLSTFVSCSFTLDGTKKEFKNLLEELKNTNKNNKYDYLIWSMEHYLNSIEQAIDGVKNNANIKDETRVKLRAWIEALLQLAKTIKEKNDSGNYLPTSSYASEKAQIDAIKAYKFLSLPNNDEVEEIFVSVQKQLNDDKTKWTEAQQVEIQKIVNALNNSYNYYYNGYKQNLLKFWKTKNFEWKNTQNEDLKPKIYNDLKSKLDLFKTLKNRIKNNGASTAEELFELARPKVFW